MGAIGYRTRKGEGGVSTPEVPGTKGRSSTSFSNVSGPNRSAKRACSPDKAGRLFVEGVRPGMGSVQELLGDPGD